MTCVRQPKETAKESRGWAGFPFGPGPLSMSIDDDSIISNQSIHTSGLNRLMKVGLVKKSKTAFVNQDVHVRFSHSFYLIHYCNKNTAAPYRQSIPHERMSFPSAVNTAINNPQLRLLNCLRASAKPILTFLGLPSMRAAQIVAQSGLDVSIFGPQHAIPH